jgi:hypothetical protein
LRNIAELLTIYHDLADDAIQILLAKALAQSKL